MLLLLLLLLLLPRGETAREEEAEECSIVQRFRLLKATAHVVGDTRKGGAEQGKQLVVLVVVVQKEKTDWLRCAERKKGWWEKSRIGLIQTKHDFSLVILCLTLSLEFVTIAIHIP